MLSLPELLLLVGIGAVGLYLALPRGPESESRAVRPTGAVLGAVSVVFLALATWRSLPGWADSRLSSLPGSLVFHGLALVAVIAAGAAVTSRPTRWSGGALCVLLGAAGGLAMFVGQTRVGLTTLAVGVAAGAATILAVRRISPGDNLKQIEVGGENAVTRESAREPLLACAAGALLAMGLLAAAHAAVADELPLTAAVERNARPASQRYRSFPRTSLLGAVARRGTISERPVGTSPATASDLPLLHRLLSVAALVFAVGTVGLLARRNIRSCGVSGLVSAIALVLLVVAFSGLPFRSERTIRALLPMVVLAIEGGLLLLLAGRLPRSSPQSPVSTRAAAGSDAIGGRE